MDIRLPMAEVAARVDRLCRESVELRAQARRAVEECRLLRAESRQHARELYALGQERVALPGRG
jgi:hypothetical protein